ncbi:MAG: YhdP family protein, partial [Burkholderiales bacterium]
SLSSHKARIDMPKVFRDPLTLDALTAQIGWKQKQGQTELKLANISFANADLAGTAYGDYLITREGPGEIDLNANLVRADARKVSHYIPLVVGADARDWLDRAFLAGTSDDVRLRLKGNLADFPFADGKKGQFQVTAKFKGGTLDYAPGWPKIENIEGSLAFRGKGMEVDTRQGTIFGVKLGKVHASIADLFTGEEVLELQGEAQGSTADTLRFVNESPVYRRVEGFTDNLKAAGNGALLLKLTMPLRHIDDSRVQGSYRFLNNRISDNNLPTLEQVNGVLNFSDSGVKLENVAAQIFGGAAQINAASAADGSVKVKVRGKLNAAGLRKVLPAPIANRLHGETDWRAQADVRRQDADLTVDSNLAGLGVDLPAPFTKRSRDLWPLHLEKRSTGEKQDRITLTVGKLLSAQLQRQNINGEMRVKRGTLGINKSAPPPASPGIWLSGTLDYLDLDQWMDVMGGKGSDTTGIGGALAGADLNIAKVILLNREFHALSVNGRFVASGWQAKLSGKEVGGDVSWEGGAKKKLSARLKYLIVPPAMATLKPPTQAAEDGRDFPSLDVITDSLEWGKRKLGRFELLASPRTDDWRIDHFRLTNSDFGLQGNGSWLNWRGQSRTSLNLQLDVQNVGRFLGSFGFPGAVKGGSAVLTGRLAWEGGPGEIGYSSLTGKLTLEAHNGQFLKIDPGIGKLLGIISLQALPRRISLDFRDVFSDGFAFDKISGSMLVNHGIVSSDDFTMVGPAALVSMSGQTDLAKETQNLQVRVVPSFSDSVSVAGAFLGGPVVGITSLIVQKMLKDPLGQITAYSYAITGNWTDPIVTKIDRNAPQPGASLNGGSP